MNKDDVGARPVNQAMMVLCLYCDGYGHDDDILCPMPCDYCNGTGFEPDDEYLDEDEGGQP